MTRDDFYTYSWALLFLPMMISVGLFYSGAHALEKTVDGGDLALRGGLGGGLCGLVAAIVGSALLGDGRGWTKLPRRKVIGFCVGAPLLLAFCCSMMAGAVNNYLAWGPVTASTFTVLAKQSRYGRIRSDILQIAGSNTAFTLRVDKPFLDASMIGSDISVDLQKGFLGYYVVRAWRRPASVEIW
jgi:hypothetical protein